MQSYFLGIDIGTGSTKAVALNKKGEVLCSKQSFYPSPTSHAEQDPEMIWNAFTTCIQEVVRHMQQPPIFIALSSAMHSIMAVDGSGTPLTPLLTWADNRAGAIATDLLQQPLGKALYQTSGTPIHAFSPLCKIAWWQQHAPEVVSKAAKFIGIKEWVWHRLFSAYEIDYALASATGLFHLHAKTWNNEALHFAGIAASQLSNPVPTTFMRKALLPSVAQELNLPAETAFIIGASDGCLANLGTAVTCPGIAAITIGTSAAVRITAPQPKPFFEAQLFNYILDESAWVIGGPINNGGASLQWIAGLLHQDGIDDAAVETIGTLPPGSDGLLFLPYLLGERAPIWDSNSSAAFIGLRSHHGSLYLLKAVIEGVCFALQSVLQLLEQACGPVHTLHLSGGFTKSDAALQVLAHCTGKRIGVLQTEDASAIGAVFLGWKATGIIQNFNELPSASFIKTIEPDAKLHAAYLPYFQLYQSLYPILKNTMHQLQGLRLV